MTHCPMENKLNVKWQQNENLYRKYDLHRVKGVKGERAALELSNFSRRSNNIVICRFSFFQCVLLLFYYSGYCPLWFFFLWKSKVWAALKVASLKLAVPPNPVILLHETADRAQKMVVIHEPRGVISGYCSSSISYNLFWHRAPLHNYEAIEMSSAAAVSSIADWACESPWPKHSRH